MNRFWTSSAFLLVLSLVLVPTASAHTPIGPGNNESLASATVIPNSAKSWAVYAELHTGGEAQYYRFDATKGETVPIQLYTSPSKQDAGFVPSFVLMGPGIPNQGSIPSYVEKPAGAGYLVVPGAKPAQATYEAFVPSVFVQVAELSFVAPADGTYYVAVFNDTRGGHYGVAIGSAETFTPYQWISGPFAYPSIYVWEGQNLLLVYLPAFLVFAIGIGWLVRRQRRGQSLDLVGWLAAIAGLLFLGTGATVATQSIFALLRSTPDALLVATVLFAALPIVLGVLTLRLAIRSSGRWTVRSRIYLALLGVLAIIFWAGWLVGSGIAIVAALIPSRGAEKPPEGPDTP